MKKYNKIYRHQVYELIQKYMKDGYVFHDAMEKCCTNMYCYFMGYSIGSEVYPNFKNLYKVHETLLASTLYIDLMKFMNTQMQIDDDIPLNLKTKYEIMKSCKTYDEIINILKSDYELFKVAVNSVYEIEERFAFSKIIFSQNLSESENKRLLSIFPNYLYDLEQYLFPIDKDYIINKINELSDNNVEFETILCEVTTFIAWLNNNHHELYQQLIENMANDVQEFTSKIKETVNVEENKVYMNNFNDLASLPKEELIRSYEQDDANLEFGTTAFICMETNYGKNYFGENIKHEK